MKLTKPMEEDEDDFFPGSKVVEKPVIKPEPVQSEAPAVNAAAELDKFATRSEIPEAEDVEDDEPAEPQGFFASLGLKKPARPVKAAVQEPVAAPVNPSNQVAVFTPKTFGESAMLADYLRTRTPVVMTLDGIDEGTARRLLDYMAGIACALQGTITPVGPKTYFVTAQNIDVVGNQL